MNDRGDEVELTARPARFRETFDAFYVREYHQMVALAAAVSGSRTAAEDLAQEAMVRALRHWDRIAEYDRPGTWARRVTINLASSHVRRLRVEARSLLRLGRPRPIPPPSPEHTGVWEELRRLPARQRAAIALFYLEDRPVEEIAEIMECAPATARVHLHRGRQALAAALGGDA
jgi:RNA polymerase sigma-70 factor (ECF subfamily)